MNGDLTILIYHRVLAAADALLPGAPDQRTFARHMQLVKRCYRVLPLASAVSLLRQGGLPPRSLAITFDDGYADNAEVALPVLRALDLPATFFIATGYIDGGRMWNDAVLDYVRQQAQQRSRQLDCRFAGLGILPMATLAQQRHVLDSLLAWLKYLPCQQREALATSLAPPMAQPPMMNAQQLRSLRDAGMTLGAHTHRHPILARLDDGAACAEIARSVAVLTDLLGRPVTLFAYPNGKPGRDFDARHVAMLPALGLQAAVTTVAGVAGCTADAYRLPRFTPWQTDRPRFLLSLMRKRRRARCGPTPGIAER